MNGLVEYDDDSQSDSENQIASSSKITLGQNDKSLLKSGIAVPPEPRKIQKSQVIIRRTTAHKNQSRAHLSSDIDSAAAGVQPSPQASAATAVEDTTMDDEIHTPSSSMSLSSRTPEPAADELSRIRALLVPPPIPGVEDWGIPCASSDPPDPAIVTKLAQFHTLKNDPTNPRHFNDSLMSNRSFRNPHLFAKLVEFVDVDERTTNFEKAVWDLEGFEQEWFAEKIAEYQREHSDQAAAAQSTGKRTHVNFTSASSFAKPAGVGSAVGRKSRFQPYYFEPGAGAKSRK